jgi:hypothetical protein
MTFGLPDPVPGVQRYYSDLATLGKHYLVHNALFPDKKRQYTICNCMEKTVYSEYLKVIETFKTVMRVSSPVKKMSPWKKQGNKIQIIMATGKDLNKNMDKIKFHKEFLDEEPSNIVTLVIKNYMTRDGLSRRIA